MRKVAVYCGTRNLYLNMLTAAKSLLINTKMDQIYFIIEDEKFPYPIPDPCIKCINVADQTYFDKKGPNYNNSWTYMVLMRAALSKILPEEDVVLSLDIDTIVDKDISELWDLPIQNYYLAAVKEVWKSTGSFTYINMGVALLNLKAWRETKLDDEIIYSLNHFKYENNEQDCINEKCQGHILKLSPNYNVNNFVFQREITEKKIIHFAGVKDWKTNELVIKYQQLGWPYKAPIIDQAIIKESIPTPIVTTKKRAARKKKND